MFYHGTGMTDLWQGQAVGQKPVVSNPPTRKELCRLLFCQFVDLHNALQQGQGSTRDIWLTLGRAHPGMVAKYCGQYVQQDVDEAVNLLLQMLIEGMLPSGVPLQVSMPSVQMQASCH